MYTVVTGPPGFGVEPELMEFATSKDAALAVTFAPYASGTLDHARILNKVGVPIVSITDSAFSPLAPLSDIWFEIVENEHPATMESAAEEALKLAAEFL